MNSPLIPQGSNVEQQDKARSSLKTKVFIALGVNVAVLLALLLTPGCKREQPVAEVPPEVNYSGTNVVPPDGGTNDPSAVVGSNNPQQPPTSQPPTTQPPATEPATPQPPATQPPVAEVPPASVSEYSIQKGDTYSTIAPKFHVTVAALKAANPTVDPAKLQIGKKIVIPAASVAAPSVTHAGGTTVDVGSGETTYVVKSGDTLGRLATEFHTTVKAIQSANGLADTKIKVGQKLKIPSKSSTP